MLGGGSLDERIHNAMSECRRIMFVLSSNFLASEFCMYELHKARNKLMAEGLDVLTLVILEDLPLANVPGIMTSMLQSTDYLTWTGDDVGKKLFWDKLQHQLLSPPQQIIWDKKTLGTFLLCEEPIRNVDCPRYTLCTFLLGKHVSNSLIASMTSVNSCDALQCISMW